jgi:hypothetical protein
MRTYHSFIASSAVLATGIALAVAACSRDHLEHFQDLPGLLSAIQAFTRDLAKQGQPLPSSVSLGELVSHGYISSNSVRAFEGMETKVWLSADPAILDSVLMSTRLPDGTVSAALADGSVQQFSAQGFSDHLKKSGQLGGSANGSQPIRSETNSTSSAAGSRR